MSEMTIANENGSFLIRVVNHNHFLVTMISPDGNVGRGKYELQKVRVPIEQGLIA